MATSRCTGDRSLTRCPFIRISQEVTSSSPAIMFRVVVFPQPDEPSRVTNSPSRMARLTSWHTEELPNILEILRNSMAVTRCSSFCHPIGETANNLISEEYCEDN